MRAAISLLFLLIQFTLSAQGLIAKTSPIYLLDPDKRILPLGVEYAFGKFSILAEQMVLVTKKTRYDQRQNLSYAKTNIQFRYFVDDMFSGGSLGFVGLHGTIRNHDYFASSGSFISSEGRALYFDDSTIETQNFATYLISGVQVPIARNRMVLKLWQDLVLENFLSVIIPGK